MRLCRIPVRDATPTSTAPEPALEQAILFWLAIEREPVSAAALRANLVPQETPRAFLEALRALQQRSLLESVGDGFALQNVLIEYLTERLVAGSAPSCSTKTRRLDGSQQRIAQHIH